MPQENKDHAYTLFGDGLLYNSVIVRFSSTIFVSLAASLTIKGKRLLVQTCRQSHVLVGLSVCLSGGCIVAKRLIGSGSRLGW